MSDLAALARPPTWNDWPLEEPIANATTTTQLATRVDVLEDALRRLEAALSNERSQRLQLTHAIGDAKDDAILGLAQHRQHYHTPKGANHADQS